MALVALAGKGHSHRKGDGAASGERPAIARGWRRNDLSGARSAHDEQRARIRCGRKPVVGPVAFVRPTEITPELSRLLGFLAAAKRPMRSFQKLEPARKWILAVKLSAD